MNLTDILREQAGTRGGRAALVAGSPARRRIATFAELERLVTAGAAHLRSSGLVPGDRVLLLAPIGIDLYVGLLSCLRAGMVAVVLDPSSNRTRIAGCLRRVPCAALLASRKAALLRWVWAPLRAIRRLVRLPLPAQPPGIDSGFAAPSDHPALLTFTSGSTGEPKVLVRSHGFLLAQHRALEGSLLLEAGEVDLVTLPVFLLANLASGLTSVLPEASLKAVGAVDAAALNAQIRRESVTRMSASPALLDRLARHAIERGGSLQGLRKIFTGGAPMFPVLLDRLRRAAPSASIRAVYGSSEAEPIAHLDLGDLTAEDRESMRNGNGLPAGIPEPTLDLRVTRFLDQPLASAEPDVFEALRVPRGEVGEILVSGDHVLRGYEGGRGDAETKIRVGDRVWHRTGDAGRLDGTGRLWLLGRAAARVQLNPNTVLFPFAVEAAASEEPGIFRTALAKGGKGTLLAVELENGFRRDEVLGRLAERLSWAGLDRIVAVKRIPVDRRHNAKVDYPALNRLLERIR